MTNTLKLGSTEISRRSILQAGAAIGTLPILALSVSPALAKMSPTSVAYQDSPKGAQNCANCSLFLSPNACKSVDGTISPNGWCKIWVKKAG
jgi:hypothetical protein